MFDRIDLFAGEVAYGSGCGPRKFLLCNGLTPEQKQEALAIVSEEYPTMGYGTFLDTRENAIKVGSAD